MSYSDVIMIPCTGQLSAVLFMVASSSPGGLMAWDFPSSISLKLLGAKEIHKPQPMHLS